MPIDPLPQPPLRTMTPSVFAQTAQNYLSIGLPLFAKQATELEKNINAREAEATAANIAAQAAKEAAQAAAVAADSVAGATAWRASTTYASGDCVYGSDGQTYRAVQPSTGVDPVADETGAWVRISASGGAYKDISPGGILVSGGYRLASTGSYTLVATPKKSTQIDFMLDCEPSEADKITIVRGGETIGGRAEDMTVEDLWVKKWTMVFNGTTWVVLI